MGAAALLLYYVQLPEKLRWLLVEIALGVVVAFIAAYVYPDARAWLLRSLNTLLIWSTVAVLLVYLSISLRLRRQQLSPAGWLAVGLLLSYPLTRRVAT